MRCLGADVPLGAVLVPGHGEFVGLARGALVDDPKVALVVGDAPEIRLSALAWQPWMVPSGAGIDAYAMPAAASSRTLAAASTSAAVRFMIS